VELRALRTRFSAVLARKGLAWQAWKMTIGLLTVAWVYVLYMPASHYTADRSYDLLTRLDASIPFIPWTWWLYFPGYLFGLAFAIIAIRDDKVYLRSVAAIMLAQVLNSVVYLTMPSTFPRPVDWQGTGFTAEAIRWFWTIDPPNNTFPSSHVALATLAALALWRERNPWRWVPTLTALGIFVTVHTAKQHYWMDAVAGVAIAFLMHFLVFEGWPRLRDRSRGGGRDPSRYPAKEPAGSG